MRLAALVLCVALIPTDATRQILELTEFKHIHRSVPRFAGGVPDSALEQITDNSLAYEQQVEAKRTSERA